MRGTPTHWIRRYDRHDSHAFYDTEKTKETEKKNEKRPCGDIEPVTFNALTIIIISLAIRQCAARANNRSSAFIVEGPFIFCSASSTTDLAELFSKCQNVRV